MLFFLSKQSAIFANCSISIHLLMSRSVSFFIVSVILCAGCGQKTPTSDDVKTIASAIPEVSGDYSTEDGTGTIAITNQNDGGFDFEITVVTEDALCTGELTGRASKSGDEWTFPEEESGCTLKFTISNEALIVNEEGSCSGHGASCSFAGTYRKDVLKSVDAAPKTLNDITDYFLALPDDYFTCEIPKAFDENQRRAATKYENVKQGYMRAGFDELDNIELALFTNKEKSLSYLALVYECGGGCQCTKRHFLQYENGEWRDRFSELFPDLDVLSASDDINIALRLPENGATIEVYNFDEPEKVLSTLSWDGTKFTLQQ